MNRFILLLILAILAVIGYWIFRPPTSEEIIKEPISAKISNGWRHYEPQSGKFSVDFPVIPQHASDMINDNTTQQLKRYEMYVAEGADGAVYMVNLVTYQNAEDVTDKNGLYQSFMDDMISSNPRNQLVSSEDTKLDGLEGRSFKLKNDDAIVDSKMFLQGNTLYVLSRVAKTGIPENGDFERFITSFKLNKNNDNSTNTLKK
ncbi:MAG: hypothetical protein WC222_05270 [Parachlamydiales bacterium]|jgi:hypothetical protein